MNKGKFIVFEGPDRCGKSTQANMLADFLRTEHKLDVVLTREPGGTPLAEAIRNILLDPNQQITPLTELMLYEASRAAHTEETVIPALESGKTVICERYTMSTCAYQGYGRGIDMKAVDTLNDIATKSTKPDLTLVFLMSDKHFVSRGQFLFTDRMEQENENFRQKMREGYKKLAETIPNSTIINADNDIDDVAEMVKDALKSHKII
ncbi:MAG: dTMP kinase [Elusimicrobiaceae bacterium]|jgi:dTMP kinase|nr:dTMP kinase [Elusimicrobiaceae bacterium]MBT3954868.1 dTMP kinase [Elusimicrobiaceae bacterium]MBT4008385.1 dTMP kinase [Elusimicrobiaceae bacterium]MBT4403224.1 dTMP kinase [Elusimicrobiaceae bacterium]MBT4439434.1 dTMP kinase [Elusimicrobiaceae bacterium]